VVDFAGCGPGNRLAVGCLDPNPLTLGSNVRSKLSPQWLKSDETPGSSGGAARCGFGDSPDRDRYDRKGSLFKDPLEKQTLHLQSGLLLGHSPVEAFEELQELPNKLCCGSESKWIAPKVV
jgi:hypothetical protein